MEELKRCKRCNADKPLTDFYKRENGKLHNTCRFCKCKANRARYHGETRDKILAQNRAYGKQPHVRERRRDQFFQRKYALSLADLKSASAAQNHRCKICNEIGQLVVDHDHTTGKVRGLLCHPCNKGLGFFGDDLHVVKAAGVYLEVANAR